MVDVGEHLDNRSPFKMPRCNKTSRGYAVWLQVSKLQFTCSSATVGDPVSALCGMRTKRARCIVLPVERKPSPKLNAEKDHFDNSRFSSCH